MGQPDPHGDHARAAPYQLQEDLHPSYWGQLALRNCLRQVYVQGRGGTCRSEGGMDGTEPNMALD